MSYECGPVQTRTGSANPRRECVPGSRGALEVLAALAGTCYYTITSWEFGPKMRTTERQPAKGDT